MPTESRPASTTDGARSRRTRRLLSRRRLLIGLGALLVLFGLIQAVPYGRSHTNPPVIAAPSWDSPTTERLFTSACGDCHSNLTRWPWYADVAPSSWLIEHDIEEGRDKLNLSELGRTEIELDEITEKVRDGSMPPWQYKLIHSDARLTGAERETLIRGLTATLRGVAQEGGAEERGEK